MSRHAMELIYTGRSKRRLAKKAMLTLIRSHGIDDDEFARWLDISVDAFAAANPRLRYETFKAQVIDYVQGGRWEAAPLLGGSNVLLRSGRFTRQSHAKVAGRHLRRRRVTA